MIITIPKEYICPLGFVLMRDPVVASDGCTYDQTSLMMYFTNHEDELGFHFTNDEFELPQKGLKDNDAIRNQVIKQAVNDFIEENNLCSYEEFVEAVASGDVAKVRQLNIPDIYLLTSAECSHLRNRRVRETVANPATKKHPLLVACESGSTAMVKLLFDECGIKRVDYSDEEEYSVMFYAAMYGDAEMLTLLEQHGGSLEAYRFKDEIKTLMHAAAWRGKLSVIKYLADQGVVVDVEKEKIDPNLMFSDYTRGRSYDTTPLMLSAKRGDVAAVEFFISKKVNVNATNDRSYTALHFAAMNPENNSDKHRVLETLCSNGASLSVKSPVILCIRSGDLEGLKILIRHGADIQSYGKNALHIAVEAGSEEIATYLLTEFEFFKKHINDIDDRWGIELAFAKQEIDNDDGVSINGLTALDLAARTGNVNLFRLFLKFGADITKLCDDKSQLALHCAAEIGATEILEILLAESPSFKNAVDILDHNNQTALQRAIGKKQYSAVLLLLEHGANLEQKFNRSNSPRTNFLRPSLDILRAEATPLLLCVHGGDLQLMHLLLNRHANLAATTASGWTVLHVAIDAGHDELVIDLLKHYEASRQLLACADKNGKRPLDLAAEKGNERLFLLLIEYGADVAHISEGQCSRVIYTAIEHGCYQMLKLVLERNPFSKVQINSEVDTRENIQIKRNAPGNPYYTREKRVVMQRPLHRAIAIMRLDIVKLLLDFGADPNLRSAHYFNLVTPLSYAVEIGFLKAVPLLVENGAREEITNLEDCFVKVPAKYICPLGLTLLRDPVIASDGYTYNRSSLETLIKDSHSLTSPITGDYLKKEGWVANEALKLEFEAYVQENKLCTYEEFTQAILTGEIGSIFNLRVPELYLKGSIDCIDLHDDCEFGNQLRRNYFRTLLPNEASIKHPFLFACQSGSIAMVSFFIECTGSYYSHFKDDEGFGVLHYAVMYGDETMVTLLAQDMDVLDETVGDEGGLTLLHAATWRGNLSVIQYLVIQGMHLEAKTKIGSTPLMFSAERCDLAAVQYLLARKANVDAENKDKLTPLHYAVRNSENNDAKHEVLELLCSQHASVNAVTQAGETPILLCIESGDTQGAEILLRHGADLEITTNEGWHALHSAAFSGDQEVIGYLSTKTVFFKKHINDATGDGYVPLDLAASSGHKDAFMKLLALGADIQQLCQRGAKLPVHAAAEHGAIDVLQLIISRNEFFKANVDLEDQHFQTPMHWAISKKQDEVVELLLASGADLEHRYPGNPLQRTIPMSMQPSMGITPLLFCAQFGALPTLKRLIKHRADVLAVAANGWSVLHFAVNAGHDDIVTDLLDNPLVTEHLLNHKAKDGRTPLDFAAGNGNEKLFLLLIERGADINQICREGNRLAIHAAVDHSCFVILKTILEGNEYFRSHIDVEEIEADSGYWDSFSDRCSKTLLHKAIGNRDETMVGYLLDYGAVVNLKSTSGYRQVSPLFYAVEIGFLEILPRLVERGAKLDERGSHGQRVFHLAAEKGNIHALTLLLKLGANKNALNESSQTALHLVVHDDKYLEVLEFLLLQQLDIHAKDKDNTMPLHKALERFQEKNLKIISLLLKHGAYIPNRKNRYVRLLSTEQCQRSQALLDLFKPFGIEVEYKEKESYRSYYEDDYDDRYQGDNLGQQNEEKREIELLVNNGADVKSVSGDALVNLARLGKLETISSLVEKGVSFDVIGTRVIGIEEDETTKYLPETPLNAAYNAGKMDVVYYLVEAGVDINLIGDNILVRAAENSDNATVKFLLDHGADVDATFTNYININWRHTPITFNALLEAVLSSNYELLELLLTFKANINAVLPDIQDSRETTNNALLEAIRLKEGSIEMLGFLCERGINDYYYDTALAFAASRGKKDVIEYLLEKGGNPKCMFTEDIITNCVKNNYNEILLLMYDCYKHGQFKFDASNRKLEEMFLTIPVVAKASIYTNASIIYWLSRNVTRSENGNILSGSRLFKLPDTVCQHIAALTANDGTLTQGEIEAEAYKGFSEPIPRNEIFKK